MTNIPDHRGRARTKPWKPDRAQVRQNKQKAFQSPATTKNRRTLLLSLPPELRNLIYEYVILDHDLRVFRWVNISMRSFQIPPFLYVCKQVRQEMGPMYFSNINPSTFHAGVLDLKFGRLIKRLELMVNIGLESFSFDSIDLGHLRPSDLDNVVGLVQFIVRTGFYLKHIKASGCYVNTSRYADSDLWVETLTDAVALGQRGHAERWHETEMQAQFDMWLKQKKDWICETHPYMKEEPKPISRWKLIRMKISFWRDYFCL